MAQRLLVMEDDVIVEQVKEWRHLFADIALLKFPACLAPSILSFYACQYKLHPSVARSQLGLPQFVLLTLNSL